MRQRGGSIVDSVTTFRVVAVVAVFNVIAYLHVKDWSSIAVFVLAGAVGFSVTTNRTLAIVGAVIAASLFRATNNLMHEGMEDPKKKPVPVKGKAPVKAKTPAVKEKPKANKYDAFFAEEGMSSQLDQLQSNQAVLTNGIKALQPLMQQASSMLKGLPSGFLDEALKNFSKNKGKMNI